MIQLFLNYSLIALLLIATGLCPFKSLAQKEGYNWTMGDSLALSYQADGDSLKVEYSTIPTFLNYFSTPFNAAISDSAGRLLFYLRGEDQNVASLLDANHQIIKSGADLNGYRENRNTPQIIPLPYEPSKYAVFTQCDICENQTLLNTAYYHIVDMKANNGKGEVISKNNLLASNVRTHMSAVKHANGRDWWLLLYEINSNRYARILIDSLIHLPEYQAIGPNLQYIGFSNSGNFKFSNDGSRLLNLTYWSHLYKFDFDRCTGLLSSPINLLPKETSPLISKFDSTLNFTSFASDTCIIYLTSHKKLFQLNLCEPNHLKIWRTVKEYFYNIDTSAVTQFAYVNFINNKMLVNQAHTTGKDINSKIDWSSPLTTHIAVINYPDRIGNACEFDSLGIYTGRYCSGMPNMPNFGLQALGTAYVKPYPDYPTTICPGDSVALGAGFGENGLTYQWAPTLGLSCTDCPNPKASPLTTTVYTLSTANSNLCGIPSDAKSIIVTVKTCGVSRDEANELASLFKVYPNPAQNRLTVGYPVKNGQPAELQLTDALGRPAGTYPLPPVGELAIDTGALNIGTYFCTFIIGGRVVATQKLLIRK